MTWRHAGDSSASPDAPVSYRQNEVPKTQNHEGRVSSLGDGRWSWQAGLSYFHESSSLDSANESPFGGGIYQPTLAFDYGIHTTSTAAYGQSSYWLTDKIKLTAGMRNSARRAIFSGWPGRCHGITDIDYSRASGSSRRFCVIGV
jgi:iron complex outermembrane receptor protein